MNDTNSGAFSIMKDLDSRARIDTSIAQKNEDYLFKGFVFYKACKAMDAAFFGGQLIVNLPCKPDIVGYIYTSSGEDYGWKAFR